MLLISSVQAHMPRANFVTLFFGSIIVSIILFIPIIEARSKRCYVCRSRGALGDCRDPFWWNSTTYSPVDPVEVVPCASGWCGKSIEGKDGDHLQATERICLQRPPSDNEERCSETYYDKKRSPVFMCFCKGDLCNAGYSKVHFTHFYLMLTGLSLASYIVIMKL